MAFALPAYRAPDFSGKALSDAPPAVFAPAARDGIVPEGFHATSNFPEYVQVAKGVWRLCPESRMDCVIVLAGDRLLVKEFRNVRRGDRVLLGRTENGEEGILVHTEGFPDPGCPSEKFCFRTRDTRETPFSRDYDFLYDLLRYEREHGFVTWVLGPAVAFDRDSRQAMVRLIESGYCHAVMAGNALATHDLEADVFGTGLGQDIYHKVHRSRGHYNHLDIVNRVREIGSIEQAVTRLQVKTGIVRACLAKGIPLVLAGSIRDDGPLPETIPDVYVSQDRMREFARRTTTVIALATQLHSIAFGNMVPSYRVRGPGKTGPLLGRA